MELFTKSAREYGTNFVQLVYYEALSNNETYLILIKGFLLVSYGSRLYVKDLALNIFPKFKFSVYNLKLIHFEQPRFI